jgi:hypothetical protein
MQYGGDPAVTRCRGGAANDAVRENCDLNMPYNAEIPKHKRQRAFLKCPGR